MYGYAGKILKIDLSENTISRLDTEKYASWVGGHGIGSAIFWDLVPDKAISGFDPKNVITIMTSPLTGTLAPAAGRTEIQGIGVQSSPVEWFTRSNLGGRFGPMLKFAGWDGIVIQGRAKRPVWVDIRNSEVRIKDAEHLWGLDTRTTQEKIQVEVMGAQVIENWVELGSGRTTQVPAVLTIGPAGEKLSRLGAVIHDAGNAAGQGGFGGVWGSKNLKAVSVIGTGSISVAFPRTLVEARLWAEKFFALSLEDPEKTAEPNPALALGFGMKTPIVFWQKPKQSRPQACTGCHAGCRARHASGFGNESGCAETAFYSQFDLKRHSGLAVKALGQAAELIGQEGLSNYIYTRIGDQTPAAFQAADLLQLYGLNAFEFLIGLPYLRDLYKMGVLGPGLAIDCDLPFDRLGEYDFVEKLLHMTAHRIGIGDDLAEGFYRAAKKWGREQDLKTGLLDYPWWGLPNHYDPRAQLEWGYGSILGDRDINEHCFNNLFWLPSYHAWTGQDPPIEARNLVKIYAEKMAPFSRDPGLLDFSTENMYSENMVKLVAWHRYYSRFWKQSVLYCDFRFPDFYNPNTSDNRGLTGLGEQLFLNAVTGGNFSFVDGIDLGRKIWNLDNAIWTLQGRQRDMVRFADYIYQEPFGGFGGMASYYLPGKKDGRWEYICLDGRHIDRDKFEAWKTLYYRQEQWDTETGWPTRKGLTALGLGFAADELEKKGRIGKKA